MQRTNNEVLQHLALNYTVYQLGEALLLKTGTIEVGVTAGDGIYLNDITLTTGRHWLHWDEKRPPALDTKDAQRVDLS